MEKKIWEIVDESLDDQDNTTLYATLCSRLTGYTLKITIDNYMLINVFDAISYREGVSLGIKDFFTYDQDCVCVRRVITITGESLPQLAEKIDNANLTALEYTPTGIEDYLKAKILDTDLLTHDQ